MENMEKDLKTEIFDWIKVIVSAFLLATLINSFLIVNAAVPTGSMRATIMEGDRLIAFRTSYMFSDPSRFDIIIFSCHQGGDQLYIKRVIGLPGETVEIIEGEVFINGESIAHLEHYVTEEIPRDSFALTTIPEDSFFVLGDNRNRSHDSSSWDNSYLHRSYIIGRAIFQYFPRIRMLQ